MMLRGGVGGSGGGKDCSLAYPVLWPQGPQGKTGLTYQESTRASQASTGLWGITLGVAQLLPTSVSGDNGHCRRNSGEPQGSPPHHRRREALGPSIFALFYHFLLFKQN